MRFAGYRVLGPRLPPGCTGSYSGRASQVQGPRFRQAAHPHKRSTALGAPPQSMHAPAVAHVPHSPACHLARTLCHTPSSRGQLASRLGVPLPAWRPACMATPSPWHSAEQAVPVFAPARRCSSPDCSVDRTDKCAARTPQSHAALHACCFRHPPIGPGLRRPHQGRRHVQGRHGDHRRRPLLGGDRRRE